MRKNTLLKKSLLILIIHIFYGLTSTAQTWDLVGNSGTGPSDFVGTTDANPLHFRVDNTWAGIIEDNSSNGNVCLGLNSLLVCNPGTINTAMGTNSMQANQGGYGNCAIGHSALYSNVDGNQNVAVGASSLANNTANLNVGVGMATLLANTTGEENTAIGSTALSVNVWGSKNVAVGSGALIRSHESELVAIGYHALQYNGSAGEDIEALRNTAVGTESLNWNTTGSDNTALGYQSGFSNVSGFYNTAMGSQALYNNYDGTGNSSVGYQSLYSNTDGNYNTAMGNRALYSNINGGYNTALGYEALLTNQGTGGIDGSDNTAVGFKAMRATTTGFRNTAVGDQVLYTNTLGAHNSAVGYNSLYDNTTGYSNSTVGSGSLTHNTTGHRNVAVGNHALALNTTGQYNTAIGNTADVSTTGLYNATAIGNGAIVNAIDKVRIGNSVVGVVEGNAMYTVCDGRFKSNISEKDVQGLEFIKLLRPVVYNFESKKFDEFLMKNMPEEIRKERMSGNNYEKSTARRQTGFIAQEVEVAMKKVSYDFSGLHKPDDENDNYSLALGQFIAPMVKAMQEQQIMIDDLKSQNEEVLSKMAKLEKLLEMTLADNQKAGSSTPNMQLDQNVPNPFSSETTISYSLTESGTISLQLFNDHGEKLQDIENGHKDIGSYKAVIDGRSLKTGVYYYVLKLNGKQLLKKAIKI